MTLLRTAARSLCLLASLAMAVPMAAQVGRPPDRSPFRDIESGHSFTPFVGYMWGSGGTLGVGPHDGMIYGFRVDARISAPLTLGFQMSYGDLKRNYFDLEDTTGTALRGLIKTHVIQAEISALLNLTGKKSWHHLAPFIGVAGGLAFGSKASVDSSGYKFGTKFVFAPMAGTRIVIANGVMLRAEWRWNFWQIKYPNTYSLPTPAAETLLGANLSEWIASPSLTAGLSIGF
ncbi:MAG: hypothetical protein ABI765_00305 [Gemmatimonadota bacterium]